MINLDDSSNSNFRSYNFPLRKFSILLAIKANAI